MRNPYGEATATLGAGCAEINGSMRREPMAALSRPQQLRTADATGSRTRPLRPVHGSAAECAAQTLLQVERKLPGALTLGLAMHATQCRSVGVARKLGLLLGRRMTSRQPLRILLQIGTDQLELGSGQPVHFQIGGIFLVALCFFQRRRQPLQDPTV